MRKLLFFSLLVLAEWSSCQAEERLTQLLAKERPKTKEELAAEQAAKAKEEKARAKARKAEEEAAKAGPSKSKQALEKLLSPEIFRGHGRAYVVPGQGEVKFVTAEGDEMTQQQATAKLRQQEEDARIARVEEEKEKKEIEEAMKRRRAEQKRGPPVVYKYIYTSANMRQAGDVEVLEEVATVAVIFSLVSGGLVYMCVKRGQRQQADPRERRDPTNGLFDVMTHKMRLQDAGEEEYFRAFPSENDREAYSPESQQKLKVKTLFTQVEGYRHGGRVTKKNRNAEPREEPTQILVREKLKEKVKKSKESASDASLESALQPEP
uniref:Uncharacterized protein n=1 Tax=Pyramimonas obovata TaxID=1411642 RepID=A0A7S0WGB0_9CHLO|mmetsp:Transcript_2492/g.5169  ORF Transcript_2492/g.5169 Transcript_2492/m.5169 type:complete len:322 (+) Transcript_2492:127-1092(+)